MKRQLGAIYVVLICFAVSFAICWMSIDEMNRQIKADLSETKASLEAGSVSLKSSLERIEALLDERNRVESEKKKRKDMPIDE